MQNSYTSQLHNYITNVVPHFSDSFTTKYPIRSLSYNYTTGLATASVDPATTQLLQGITEKSFTFTNCQTALNIVSAIWERDLSLRVVFDRPLTIRLNSPVNFVNFDPISYNIEWLPIEQIDGNTYLFTTNDVLSVYNQTINTLGLLPLYVPCKGWNGLQTITIDVNANTLTFAMRPQSIISTQAFEYDLGGSYGNGCGFIHNWHYNLLIGTDNKFNDYSQTKKDYLFVISNDFTLRVNQEKQNTADVNERQDTRTGNFSRLIATFYVDYILNTTNTALKSDNFKKLMILYNILYKITGVPFLQPSPLNETQQQVYQFALGDVSPFQDENGMLLEKYRFNFSVILNYATGALLPQDLFDTFNLDVANINPINFGGNDYSLVDLNS